MVTRIYFELLKTSLRGALLKAGRRSNPGRDCFALRARNDKRRIAFAVLAIAVILNAAVYAYAEETASEEVTSEGAVIKEMVGPIIYLTPRAKPEVIYIGNDAANTDYSFIIDADTKVEHMKDLTSLKVGDTVKIKYAEVAETKKMGGRKVVVDKRIAKVISFVRAGAKKEEPGSASKQQPNVLVSD